jgi:hypothetical protein
MVFAIIPILLVVTDSGKIGFLSPEEKSCWQEYIWRKAKSVAGARYALRKMRLYSPAFRDLLSPL